MSIAPEPEYCCPDERRPISRAVHLGRLARFYPACRQCPHRHDTGQLAPRTVRQLQRSFARPQPPSPWTSEGLAGVCPQTLSAPLVRQVARALGCHLRDGRAHDAAWPLVVLGGDGRLLTAELHSAAAEGLRWSGCEVADLGATLAPAMPLAIDSLQAAAGLLMGNPPGRSATAGVKFWLDGPRPLSSGPRLERLATLAAGHLDRPTRRFGPVRPFDAGSLYRDALSGYYHALRPLRLALCTPCAPAVDCLRALVANVSCTLWPVDAPAELPRVIVNRGAHLGVAIDDDGEGCRLWDERGTPVGDERLLLLLARTLLAVEPGAIVLASPREPRVVAAIERLGGRVVIANAPLRASVDAALRSHQAVLGCGPGSRFWSTAGTPAADALYFVSRLLGLLSRSDRRLSEVLDAEAAAE